MKNSSADVAVYPELSLGLHIALLYGVIVRNSHTVETKYIRVNWTCEFHSLWEFSKKNLHFLMVYKQS